MVATCFVTESQLERVLAGVGGGLTPEQIDQLKADIKAEVAAEVAPPTGTLGWFLTAGDGDGWLVADGRDIAALRAAGLNDCADKLEAAGIAALPDMIDRYAVGSATPGASVGSNSFVLRRAQLPSTRLDVSVSSAGNHRHAGGARERNVSVSGQGSGGGQTVKETRRDTEVAGAHSHTATTEPIGSDDPIDNRPASVALVPKVRC